MLIQTDKQLRELLKTNPVLNMEIKAALARIFRDNGVEVTSKFLY